MAGLFNQIGIKAERHLQLKRKITHDGTFCECFLGGTGLLGFQERDITLFHTSCSENF